MASDAGQGREHVTLSDTTLEATISERDVGNLMVGPCIVDVCGNCDSMFQVYSPVGMSDLMFVTTPRFCPACGARITRKVERPCGL